MKNLAFWLGCFCACTTWAEIALENAALRLRFGDAEHGFAIRQIDNRLVNDTAFGNGGEADATFWVLEFWLDGALGDKTKAVMLTNNAKCRTRRVEPMSDGGAVFVWEGLDLPDEPGSVTVRARVRFDADATSRWTLEVQSFSQRYGLAQTHYPVFARVSASGEMDVLQPHPDFGARLVAARKWGEGYSASLGGYKPMMTAFFKGEAGLYFAAHDSSARLKSLKVSPEHEVSFVTPMEHAGRPGVAAEGPRYEVTVAALTGDWWAAARLYRQWALTTKWTAKGRILDRADYPRHMAEIPLWINTHAHPAEVSNTMARVRTLFPNVDAGIHWHLWQHSPHDVNYPEYFPEQPGTRECLRFCQSIGQEAMPYTNGRLWSHPTIGFPYAKPFALRRADGEPVNERYGPTPPLSPMCPFTKMWDNTLNDFATRILDLGAGSLFLDQIGACPGVACYATDHGHAPGGGTWYFDGYQRILEKTHARYSAKGAFLTTEGSGEVWMDVIDGYLNVTQRQPDIVPFFHAVYNGYTTYFCSPENQDDDLTTFRATQTRELLWGQALGWYHPLILEQADKCAVVRRLVEFRQAYKDFFAYGTLEGEITPLDPVGEVVLTWLGRKQFWAWKLPGYPLSATITGTMPGVIGYVWRNGVTGERAVFAANVTDEPKTLRFRKDGTERTVELAPEMINCFRF